MGDDSRRFDLMIRHCITLHDMWEGMNMGIIWCGLSHIAERERVVITDRLEEAFVGTVGPVTGWNQWVETGQTWWVSPATMCSS